MTKINEKENIDFFPLFCFEYFTFILMKCLFSNSLKQADVTPVYKEHDTRKTTLDRSAYSLFGLRLSKGVCMIKFMLTKVNCFVV